MVLDSLLSTVEVPVDPGLRKRTEELLSEQQGPLGSDLIFDLNLTGLRLEKFVQWRGRVVNVYVKIEDEQCTDRIDGPVFKLPCLQDEEEKD